FSGVFFTLGYVMGRNQYDGQVRAETTGSFGKISDLIPRAKSETSAKAPKETAKETPKVEPATDPVTPPSSDWEFYHAGENKPTDEHLNPAPTSSAPPRPAAPVTSTSKNFAPAAKTAAPVSTKSIPIAVSSLPRGSFTVQVAALTKQADAMGIAMTLQKKKFPAYVVPPQGDKYFRVQVGPYANQKLADAARKSIESAGFKAIVKRG